MSAGFRLRFLLGLVVLLVIMVPTYTWLSHLIEIEDRLLEVLVFVSLFVPVSTVVAKAFRWEQEWPSDERDEYIRRVTVDRATTLWMHFVFVLILSIIVAMGYGFLEVSGEVLGFIKGLGVSALALAAIYILSWIRVHRAHS
ncbi:MAG: hypothetical protein F7C08_01350 [Desulfurococcales archaeon]|nr:hypothetical protein [Desulfurococcales archaeon]